MPPLARLRILVLDDDADLGIVIGETLELLGATVRVCTAAEQALGVIDRQGFDVLLSDVVMPGQDGVELARQLRAERPDLAIVLMSGVAERARMAAESLGLQVLQKPLSAEDLIRAIIAARHVVARG
jgi:CheY-like chemotaxis protein